MSRWDKAKASAGRLPPFKHTNKRLATSAAKVSVQTFSHAPERVCTNVSVEYANVDGRGGGSVNGEGGRERRGRDRERRGEVS